MAQLLNNDHKKRHVILRTLISLLKWGSALFIGVFLALVALTGGIVFFSIKKRKELTKLAVTLTGVLIVFVAICFLALFALKRSYPVWGEILELKIAEKMNVNPIDLNLIKHRANLTLLKHYISEYDALTEWRGKNHAHKDCRHMRRCEKRICSTREKIIEIEFKIYPEVLLSSPLHDKVQNIIDSPHWCEY